MRFPPINQQVTTAVCVSTVSAKGHERNLIREIEQNYPVALHSLFLILKCRNCLNSSGIKARWLTSCRETAGIIYRVLWTSRGVVICVDCLTNDIQIDCLGNDFWLLRQFTTSYSFLLMVRYRSKNIAEG